MGLDARGLTSVGELVVYVPLLVISVCLIAKHGFRRAGWIYLLLLSIIRIVSASTNIIGELSSNPSTTLLIVTGVTQSAGLSPLLEATLGFYNTISQHAFEEDVKLRRGLRLMHILVIIALGLTISGGVAVGSNENPDAVDKINTGIKERRIGAALFVVQYALTVLVAVYLWSNQNVILKQRRRLLKAITASIPFLAVRVAYSVLTAFAPTGLPFPGVDAGVSQFSAFNSTTGNFVLYLVMSVLMEFIVIVIYATAGLRIPLQNDYAGNVKTQEENIGLYANTAYTPSDGYIRSASSISVAQNAPEQYVNYPTVYNPRGY